MKVVHISRFGDGSGPAIAASQLHKGLLQLGHESMMFVAQTHSAVQGPYRHALPAAYGPAQPPAPSCPL